MTSTMSCAVSVRCSSGKIQPQFLVQLQPPDRRKIVSLGVHEQIVEERPGRFDRGRFSRPQTAIDLDHRLFFRRSLSISSVSRITGVDVTVSK